jgi:hypothetical protein
MASRTEINATLKAIVIFGLREMGFTGSYPHLRREHDGAFDLMTFQFNKYGGSLTVEIARCLPSGIDVPSGGHIPASKANAYSRHPNYRRRLGAYSDDRNDCWFIFADQDAHAVARLVLKRLSDPTIWDGMSSEGDEAPYRKQV